MKILHISKNWFDTKVYDNLYINLKKHVNQFVIALIAKNRNLHSKDADVVILKCIYTKLIGLYNLKIHIIYHHIITLLNLILNYELIHAHFLYFDGDIAYRIKKKYNIPYVVTVRTSDIYIFDKRFYLRNRGIRILESSSKIVFISYAHKNYFFNRYFEKHNSKETVISKTVVIPNGIEEFWHENRRNTKKILSNNSIELLTVAGIDSNKNHKLVVDSIIELQKKGYHCNYTIIGEILNKSIFNELLKYSFVKYVKPLPKEELLSYYRNADIFVMPSHSETFGLVYIEAISQGTPVIYTRNQGIDGFFSEGEVGFSVNAKDKMDLLKAVIKIINNYDQFDFNNIDLGSFKWDRIAEKYYKLYSNILT